MTEHYLQLKSYNPKFYRVWAEKIDELWHQAYPPSMGDKRPDRTEWNVSTTGRSRVEEWTERNFQQADRMLKARLRTKRQGANLGGSQGGLFGEGVAREERESREQKHDDRN